MRFLLEKVLESLDFLPMIMIHVATTLLFEEEEKRIDFFLATCISILLRSDLYYSRRAKLINPIFRFRYRSPSLSIAPSPFPSLNRTRSKWPDTFQSQWRGQFRSRSKFRYRLLTRSKCPNPTPFHTWNRYRCPWCNLQSWSRSTITAVGQAATPPGKRNQSFLFSWIRGS